MSTDILPQIPEFLLKQKEEARAARAERLKRAEDERHAAEARNREVLAAAIDRQLGPEVAALLLWPANFNDRTEQVSLELLLDGHAPIICQFGRTELDDNGKRVYRWVQIEYEKCQGTPLFWEVDLPGHTYRHRVATLGEALVLAEEGFTDDPEVSF